MAPSIKGYRELQVKNSTFRQATGENPNRFFRIQKPQGFVSAELVDGTVLPEVKGRLVMSLIL